MADSEMELKNRTSDKLKDSPDSPDCEQSEPLDFKRSERIDLSTLVSLSDFELAVKDFISPMAYEYLLAGASDEVTLGWNRQSFNNLRLRPRVLIDVSEIDTNVRLLGERLPFPILLAPCAYQRLFHEEGELATVRGANQAKAIFTLSTMGTTSVEAVVQEATNAVWFQLYVQRDKAFTKSIIQRVEDAGVKALMITVDTPVIGTRNRETRIKFQLPSEFERPQLSGFKWDDSTTHRPRDGEIYSSLFDPKLNWKDVEWMCSFARVPVLLKGILNPDDAAIACDSGVAGVIVSNHGARNLDTVPAAIDALPEVVERIAGRMPVLMDGGVRRGTDVLKAIAFGADAVFIGRPYLYGLGVAGAAGVARVINILRNEFEMAMALTGCTSIEKIGKTVIW
ncbi:MAG: alpha-hydroxy acid oxidase [Acidobacteriota bacterium]